MKVIFSIAMWIFCIQTMYGYQSAFAIHSGSFSQMQVAVNGKIWTNQTPSFVRVKSKPGLFHLEVKIFDPEQKIWHLIKKEILVKKGWENHFRIVFAPSGEPVLEEWKKYPVFKIHYIYPHSYIKNQVT